MITKGIPPTIKDPRADNVGVQIDRELAFLGIVMLIPYKYLSKRPSFITIECE